MKKSEILKMALNQLRVRGKISTNKDAAIAMGADPSNISRHLNGKPEPSDNFMIRLNEAFENIFNQHWLLTGEGSMLVDGQSQQHPQPAMQDVPEFLSNAVRSEEITDLIYAAENKHGGIFYRDGRGQLYMSAPHAEFAARGEFPNEADSLEPNGEWTREVYKVDKVARGRYISFTVLGNSMDNVQYKSLRDGDKVLTRELERDNWRTLRAGDHRYWVIVFDTSVLIKEIASFDAATGNITCHSLNPSPEYHDFTLNLDNVRHLFYGIRVKPGEYEI